MRSMWTGTLTAGMVTFPVRLGTAVTETGALELHQVRRSDGSRVRYQAVAEADGARVYPSEVTRGFETQTGEIVMLTDADFTEAYGDADKNARVTRFTRTGSVPRTAKRASYIVQPGAGGEQAYALLARVMEARAVEGVVEIMLRNKMAVGLLYASAGYLTLELLEWATQVRTPDFAAPVTENPALEQLASDMVAEMTGEFNWPALVNSGEERLRAIIQARIENGQVTGTPAPARGAVTPPQDLMAALEASVAAAKAAKAPVRKTRSRRAAA